MAQYQPHPTDSTTLIKHLGYALNYNEVGEQPDWVYYYLSPDRVGGEEKRGDNFRSDPLVITGSAEKSDYKSSGYDRGHLCPAADNSHDPTAMSESFYMSNMSPQLPGFNRGVWKSLEEQFRVWAVSYHGIYVVTAGILTDSLKTIGENKVAVPNYYYKIAYSEQKESMIGFLLPNASSSDSLGSFIVPVDSIEQLTGIDFFYQLEDDLEQSLESNVTFSDWEFGRDIPMIPFVNKNKESNSVKQCAGMAKSTGVRCLNMTSNKNGYCTVHQSQAKE